MIQRYRVLWPGLRGLCMLLLVSSPAAAQLGVVGGTIDFSGRSLELRKFVRIPDSMSGIRPRINYMTDSGIPGDERLFVVDEGRVGATSTGVIHVVDPTAPGSPSVTPFLDVGAAVLQNTGRLLSHHNGHAGVRSIAFHPDFDVPSSPGAGRIYTSILEDIPSGTSGFNYLGPTNARSRADSVLVEWVVDTTTGVVDPASYREILRVALPVYDHPMKQVAFNPYAQPGDEDYGLLYIAHGDAGTQNGGTGQTGFNALGKVLRIKPLQDGDASYSVPETNPFTDDATKLDEIFALGFRNPHRFTWAEDDSGQVRMVLSDIGQNNVEEINLVHAGQNYGWRHREGTFVNNGSDLATPLPSDDGGNGYTYPVAQYGHFTNSIAIVGGFVVPRGPLSGEYLFGDFPTSGRLFHVGLSDIAAATTMGDPTDLTPVTIQELSVLFDHDDNPATPSLETTLRDVVQADPDFSGGNRVDTRFGQGGDRTIYVTSKRNGWIYEVMNRWPADLNYDEVIDALDAGIVFAGWGSAGPGDLNRDGTTDAADASVLFGQWTGDAVVHAIVPEPGLLSTAWFLLVPWLLARRFRFSQ